MTDIATVLKFLLDSLIPRQFLDLLEHITGPTPKSVKRRGLGGYADAKSPAGDCASGLGLVHANHVLIRYNFA